VGGATARRRRARDSRPRLPPMNGRRATVSTVPIVGTVPMRAGHRLRAR